nr:MAG TPA: hypothetical protein [Caudoviricetes sp.]
MKSFGLSARSIIEAPPFVKDTQLYHRVAG